MHTKGRGYGQFECNGCHYQYVEGEHRESKDAENLYYDSRHFRLLA